MERSCGFVALSEFIPKDKKILLTLKTFCQILKDAGYKVKAYSVIVDSIDLKELEVQIGYKDEHYYLIEDTGECPDIIFLSNEEFQKNIKKVRPLTVQEVKQIKGGKGGGDKDVLGTLLTVASFIPGINAIAAPLNAAYGLYQGIENKNPLQIAGSALGGVGQLGKIGTAAGSPMFGTTMQGALKTTGSGLRGVAAAKEGDYFGAALHGLGAASSGINWRNSAISNNPYSSGSTTGPGFKGYQSYDTLTSPEGLSTASGPGFKGYQDYPSISGDRIGSPDTALGRSASYVSSEGRDPFSSLLPEREPFSSLLPSSVYTNAGVRAPGIKGYQGGADQMNLDPSVSGQNFVDKFMAKQLSPDNLMNKLLPMATQLGTSAVSAPDIPQLYPEMEELYQNLYSGKATTVTGQKARDTLDKYLEYGGGEQFDEAFGAVQVQIDENYDEREKQLKSRFIAAGGFTGNEGYAGQYHSELRKLQDARQEAKTNAAVSMKDMYMQRQMTAIEMALGKDQQTINTLFNAANVLGMQEQVEYAMKVKDTQSLRESLSKVSSIWFGEDKESPETYDRYMLSKTGSGLKSFVIPSGEAIDTSLQRIWKEAGGDMSFEDFSSQYKPYAISTEDTKKYTEEGVLTQLDTNYREGF